VISIVASVFTILELVVRDKWDADAERSIDELGLLVFQAFPILYYYDINGSKGKLAVFGGIVIHLAFGTSLFFLSLGLECDTSHFAICAIVTGLFLTGIFFDKIRFYQFL
jgi:hypothetical protein